MKKLFEDLEISEVEIPDYTAGAKEYTDRILAPLKNNPDIKDLKLYPDELYPLRKDAFWWCEQPILEFKYKDLLEIYFYCGGENCIYRDDDDNDPITTAEDLEDMGIFTDRDYYDFMNENDMWSTRLTENHCPYFGFIVTPLKNNHDGEEYYSYDLGYDDKYAMDEVFPLDWVFTHLIPEFKNDHLEYFPDEEAPEQKLSFEESKESKKKHITKGQILNDVISTFGTISTDKLTDAIYLLPNGKILDTKGNNEKSQHINVANYISKKYNIKDVDENDGSKLMLELGAMRITPWIPALFISEVLTEKQENTLYDILLSLSSKVSEDSPLMVATPSGDQQIEFSEIKNPNEVINSILGYQLFGILKS